MKKTNISLGGGIVLASVLAGLSSQSMAGVADTKHNLSSTANTAVNEIYSDNPEICVFCHTPHAAIKNENIPLWNHELSAYDSYGVYSSPTFDGASTISPISGATPATATVSNLCLSCHDGTVAINALNNPSNAHPTTTMLGAGQTGGVINADRNSNLLKGGSDLTDDHPVNFTYDAALATADGGLVAPASLTDVKLYNGTVQCASCHDPHNDTASEQPFLRFSMTGSALCLKCHIK